MCFCSKPNDINIFFCTSIEMQLVYCKTSNFFGLIKSIFCNIVITYLTQNILLILIQFCSVFFNSHKSFLLIKCTKDRHIYVCLLFLIIFHSIISLEFLFFRCKSRDKSFKIRCWKLISYNMIDNSIKIMCKIK